MRASYLTSRRGRRQGGFTVVELLVAIAVTGLVIGSAGVALNLTSRQNAESAESLSSSNGAFQTGTRFADDVASVTPVSGVTDLIAAGVPGCGGTTAVLRLVGSNAGGEVQVRSYDRSTAASRTELVRRECTGGDLAAALAAAGAATTVVSNLDPAASSTAVDCDGGTVGVSCRVLTMTVSTASGRVFAVRGSVAAALNPTPTTAPQLSVAPVVGTCTIPASATAWGTTGWGAGGSSSTNYNPDQLLYTYNDGNQRRSFLKFDLTQSCVGASDSWPTLPGGRNITGATLYLAYMGKVGCCFSYDGHIIEALNDTSTWSEATLTGSNMPGGVRSGASATFSVSNQGTLSAFTGPAIVDAVKGWYAPGGWVNNGWRLSRSGAGDTTGKSNTFASRFNADTAVRPKLVITWGP